jgi:hypothetical protein
MLPWAQAGTRRQLVLVLVCDEVCFCYETRILQPIAYRIPGYVSDTDTRWIRLGYVSVEYPEKNADKSDTFSDMY